MEGQGIEDLKKCIQLAGKNIKLGMEIAEGGLDSSDLQYAAAAFSNIKDLIEFISEKPDLLAEIKDIDAAEGFALIQEAYKAFNEIKG